MSIGQTRFPSSSINRSNFPLPLGSIQISPAVPPRYRFQRAGSLALRPSTRLPLESDMNDWTWPQRCCFGSPPSGEIEYPSDSRKKGVRASDTNSIACPFSDQPTTLRTSEPKYVSRLGTPPEAGITHTSG